MKIWTLTEGNGGINSQVRGLAEALGFETVAKKVDRRMPWALLPATWARGASRQLKEGSDSLEPPYPDIVISAGRRSIPFSIELGRLTGGKMVRLHLQDPRINPRYFDHVIVAEHDRLRGPHVLVGAGPLHSLTLPKLEEAAQTWGETFRFFPRPLTAFVLGGHTNRYHFTQEVAKDLIRAFESILEGRGGLIILTSSRTPVFLKEQIAFFAKGKEGSLFFYGGQGPNPYIGALALADQVVVTNDSSNMMFEACYTGKPVFTFPLRGHEGTPPFRLSLLLEKSGFVRPFSLPFERWTYTPPRETERIASLLKQHYGWPMTAQPSGR